MSDTVSSPKTVVLSKTKYKTFSAELEKFAHEKDDFSEEHVKFVLNLLCTVCNFDPSKSTYDKARVQRMKEETGKSYYELFNKKFYDKNKEELDRKNTERTRLRRAALKASKAALEHNGDSKDTIET